MEIKKVYMYKSFFFNMFPIEDLIGIVVLCVSTVATIIIVINFLERKHKTNLDFEKRRLEAESDTSLMKAKIYADKDLRIANMENQVMSEIPSTGTQLDEYLPILNAVAQNPDLIKNLLNKK
jgi:hypothetical protein